MNISPKTYDKLLTVKIEKDLFNNFKEMVGERNMSASVRKLIKDLLKDKEKITIGDEVEVWMNDLEDKKSCGLLHAKDNPFYNFSGYDFDGPPDYSVNHDRYLYEDGN